ncbi:hypothetical protein HPB52_016886 [Rhipicephalus sanguineus]|uniref:THAP-type domain-containing protein n=1 Tax=Rhipicephalus sanguineus TaxID=34632 RepID=A0A9D4PS21_RHISA|nr:hypothetical protein HPB52_016886 [Rhipicephalus sanguineus]
MCCVPQCTNRAVKDEISLHSFPLDARLKKEWVVKLRIGKPVTPPMKVCSAHFISEDFFWSSIDPKVWTPNRRRTEEDCCTFTELAHKNP